MASKTAARRSSGRSDGQRELALTVDVALLTVHEDALRALMVRRRHAPYAGCLALPGGFVDLEEDLKDAARRELAEETGVEGVVLEQLATYGEPHRDPRGRMVSVAHLAVMSEPVPPRAGDDAGDALWVPVEQLLGPGEHHVAFDHARILADAVERVRGKLERTTLATAFVGEEFTMSELRRVYEVVWGRELDPGNFQRKVRQTEDFVVETGELRPTVGRGRPAATFRARYRDVRPLNLPLGRTGPE